MVVCVQPPSLGSMSRGRRWAVFVIAMVETMLWSGTIFGWASLVHALKLQGVYYDLCPMDQLERLELDPVEGGLNTTTTVRTSNHSESHTVCLAQDDRMALMYTVACVVYSTPGVFIGYALHHFGLAFTRVMGGLMVSCGFILLSCTTAATPDNLWGATILLAVGGNTIRMAGLQFGNLFPEHRNTAMAIISGIFTPSAGIMVLLQTMYEGGFAWHHICWIFAALSSLVIVLTPFIPRHHIPVTHDPVSAEDPDDKVQNDNNSLMRSLCSLSSGLHMYWLFINLSGVTIFSTHFNTWINRFAQSEEEAGLYSRLFGLANILCVFVTPLPGLMMDLLTRRFQRGKSGLNAHVASLQAMVLPLVMVCLTVTIQTTMLFFRSPWAVFVGLACLMINRPSCLAVGNPFLRARYPADHFNRLVGIQGTLLSFLTFIQYPHFTWAQHAYNLTFGCTIVAMVLSLSHPLHLLSKTYLRSALLPSLSLGM